MGLFRHIDLDTLNAFWARIDTIGVRTATRANIGAFLVHYLSYARVTGEYRGWWFTSIDHISKVTGLTAQNVRTVLKRLRMAGETTLKPTSTGTSIKLSVYNQLCDFSKRNQQGNQQTTNNE